MRALRLKLLFLTLVVGLLLPASATAHSLSICTMSRGATRVCHCVAKATKHCRNQALDRDGCCVSRLSHVKSATGSSLHPSFDVPPAALLALLPSSVELPPVVAASSACPERSRAPPHRDGPVILRTQRVLS